MLQDHASRNRLVESPWECAHCVAIARRWARLGRTCSSALAVGGASGVGAAFLVTDPVLTPAQWLGILLFMQLLVISMWTCAWLVCRTLEIRRSVVSRAAPKMAAFTTGQVLFSIAFFPNHQVPAQSSTWWWLVADGIGWAIAAVLLRDLFFDEVTEAAVMPEPESVHH